MSIVSGPGNEPTPVPPDPPAPEPITPERLAARFGTSSTRRDDALGCTIATGFCGLSIMGARDRMISGFDDGYDFMGFLEERGWHALADKGDWPYVVYLTYKARDPYAIAEYCECDFTLWTFDDGEAAQAFYKTLRDNE